MKDTYTFVAIFQYDKDGINIRFPDIEEAFSCAKTEKEALKNAKEVLELTLYNREKEGIEIPESSQLEDIKCNENEKLVIITISMSLVRSEMESLQNF